MQERRKLTMASISPLSLVCPSQREVCPQPSCGQGSGKMSLARCTAVPVCGGKKRGLDTKVTVANVLPLISSTLSANSFKPFFEDYFEDSMYFLMVNVICSW